MFLSNQRAAVYEAEAKVFIGPRAARADSAGAALEELAFSREYVSSYAELLKSRPVAERTIERLGIRQTPADLVEDIRTRVLPETRIISVVVAHTDPAAAARIANTLTETFVSEVQQEFGSRAGANAHVYEPAVRPTERVSPKPLRDGVLAGVLGLMLGIGLAVVLEQLDTRIRSREDIERHLPEHPILAEMPRMDDNSLRKLLVASDPDSPGAESFRILRTNVQFLAVDLPISRIIVTSPYAEDGKTTVAANLAAALAVAGYRTLLVETDLRRPTVQEYFGMGASPGIADVLLGRRSLEGAIRDTHVRDLYVLTSGPLPPNPSELLGSQRMVELLDEASTMVDVLVLDSPPTLPVTDSTVLAPRTDGVVLVVRAGRTHVERARESLGAFARIGVRVLGLVLNDAPIEASSRYYTDYYTSAGGKSRRDERAFDTPGDIVGQPAASPQATAPAFGANAPMPSVSTPGTSAPGTSAPGTSAPVASQAPTAGTVATGSAFAPVGPSGPTQVSPLTDDPDRPTEGGHVLPIRPELG